MSKIQVLTEIWEFICLNKKFWLLPIVGILVLAGLLIVLAEGTAIAPFIYTLF